ncbi:alkyl hydroperoxide reductase [Paramagnetospirillum marisnigri]|uniref:Alkyl hydroperoxide reductase n=1 Tax=Paramagnetospirillum marisnigri TaxID=1285242 RepID=A0A178MFA9_9PROT|nr:thioredoxin family protein [Paramagnetospirillum marisnigri]OAN46745.1 alkyl hydroperoxide reductase [Paramagnetospirillum marisnigri]
MAVETPCGELGQTAPDFTLPGIDGKMWSLADKAGPRGTLVAFICNHCPYVVAIIDRLARDAAELSTLGIGVVAINANDAIQYPEDSFAAMKEFAARHRLGFPYLHDESQEVARAYGAVCTPDFFGYDKDLRLCYRGRLDASGRLPGAPDARRELFEAMRQVAETGMAPTEQVPCMGCSIKWRY